jgi:hypothetical protein
MSRSGIYGQFGMVQESTVGTAATVTRFLEFVPPEGLQLEYERVESEALRSANRVLRADRWAAGRKTVAGEVEFEVADKGFSMLLSACLGTIATIGTPTGGTNTRDHVTVLASTGYGRSWTLQVGRPDTAGTVQPFTYNGCKVVEWEISNEVDGILKLNTTWDGWDEATGISLAAASYPSNQTLLHWVGGTMSVGSTIGTQSTGGTAVDVKSVSLTGSLGLNVERYFLRGSAGTIKKEHIEAEMAEFGGEVTLEFNSLADYARFTAGTTYSLSARWDSGTNTDSGTVGYFEAFYPTVRFDGQTPNVTGPDILELTLPFKVLNNPGTNSPVRFYYRTTDTTA